MISHCIVASKKSTALPFDLRFFIYHKYITYILRHGKAWDIRKSRSSLPNWVSDITRNVPEILFSVDNFQRRKPNNSWVRLRRMFVCFFYWWIATKHETRKSRSSPNWVSDTLLIDCHRIPIFFNWRMMICKAGNQATIWLDKEIKIYRKKTTLK